VTSHMAKRRPQDQPDGEQARREPTQPRARETIETILEGALRVLKHDGWTGFTTNSVAQSSGVSVGSLYQYFANKDEIAVALVDKHYRTLKAEVACELRDGILSRDPGIIALAVNRFTNALTAHDGLYFTIMQELASPAKERIAKIFDETVTFLAFTFLIGKDSLRHDVSTNTAFVVTQAVEGVLAAAHSRRMPPEQIQQIQAELAMMVTKYIAATP